MHAKSLSNLWGTNTAKVRTSLPSQQTGKNVIYLVCISDLKILLNKHYLVFKSHCNILSPSFFSQLPSEKTELRLCHVPADRPLPRVMGEWRLFFLSH